MAAPPRLKRLPMCLKTPLKNDAERLGEHDFVEVFDVLKICALAVELGHKIREGVIQRRDEAEKKLSIHLGLKNDCIYDGDSLPVKLEFQNVFIMNLFNQCARNISVIDNSDARTETSASISQDSSYNR